MEQLIGQEENLAGLEVLLKRSDRIAPTGRPWLMANMVSSADGAYAVSGVSKELSSPEDREIFHALRAAADAVLVAAGTARTEHYRRPTPVPEMAAERLLYTPKEAARLVVVSKSLRIDSKQPFLNGPGQVPLLMHPEGAVIDSVPAGVELRAMGQTEVDLDAALRSLYQDGIRVVLCEGGPSLLGQLHELDLIDELFLSIAPILVGGPQVGILGGQPEMIRRHRLHRLWHANSFLFLTYRRDRELDPAQ